MSCKHGYPVDFPRDIEEPAENATDITTNPKLTDRNEVMHWPNGSPRLVRFRYGETRRSFRMSDDGIPNSACIYLGPTDGDFKYEVYFGEGSIRAVWFTYTDPASNVKYRRTIEWRPNNFLDFTYKNMSDKREGFGWQCYNGKVVVHALYKNGKIVEKLKGEYIQPSPPPWKFWPDGRITKREIEKESGLAHDMQASPEELKRYMTDIVFKEPIIRN